MLTRCSPLLRLAIGHARPSATLNLPKKTPRPWWDGNTRHSVHSSSIRREEDPPRKKRPSPYRLLQPHTFLAAFAPLHVAGWRLDVLPSVSTSTGPRREEGLRLEEGMNDLQGRRLIRAYQFPEGREGWRELVDFMQSIGRVVEEEDVGHVMAGEAHAIASSKHSHCAKCRLHRLKQQCRLVRLRT